MTLHPRLTRAAVALVKRFETFQPQAEPTPGNGWSIGYGHTRSAREGARISEADAEALLIYDLDVAAKAVERALFAPVSQSQFEALTALCFNLGEPAFLRSRRAGPGETPAAETRRRRRDRALAPGRAGRRGAGGGRPGPPSGRRKGPLPRPAGRRGDMAQRPASSPGGAGR